MTEPKLHEGHRKRLREQVVNNGLDSLHEHQALEYLLSFVIPQRDTNGIAHNLISHFGSYAKVLDADINELKKVTGVGDVVATFLYNFKDFFYYYQKIKGSNEEYISDYKSATKCILPYLYAKTNEEFYVVCIDANNKVIAVKKMGEGDVKSINISARSISKVLFDTNCANFLIAHNHPGGRAVPSSEDDKLTKALYLGAYINNIKMMDHLIVAGENIYSYFLDGKLQDFDKEAKMAINRTDALIAQSFAEYEGVR